jgi:hypothetical protein
MELTTFLLQSSKKVLWMSVISLILVGCSKDDENNPINPVGYWLSIECDEEDMQHQHGMAFWANGTFGEWSVTPEKFEEMPMGKWEVTDKGYHLRPSISDTGFGIISINDSYLVFETYYYWSNTHVKTTYKKMKFGPVYIN